MTDFCQRGCEVEVDGEFVTEEHEEVPLTEYIHACVTHTFELPHVALQLSPRRMRESP
ncbi:hypothetical protein DUNSADRAFT_12929 [Dunaliella salina]|uniref:Uncharacterized protein n=1 Tax=Dunaliella salina TaxID=3046 RepID=A0ABQ7GAH0_DUNSA|nr:hypothetical protein DUNSADRAFT_12929 [Dunaliella salina]|eukprot:KAF5831595.1 hypothetical protein DUNSADRAFT_12929 [Dunaliella salina]